MPDSHDSRDTLVGRQVALWGWLRCASRELPPAAISERYLHFLVQVCVFHKCPASAAFRHSSQQVQSVFIHISPCQLAIVAPIGVSEPGIERFVSNIPPAEFSNARLGTLHKLQSLLQVLLEARIFQPQIRTPDATRQKSSPGQLQGLNWALLVF
jgi:hypothetical protein